MNTTYEWLTRRIPNGANLSRFEIRRNILHTIEMRPSPSSAPFRRAGKRLQQMSMSRRDMEERWAKSAAERVAFEQAIVHLNEVGILAGDMNGFPLVNLDRAISATDYR